MNQTINKQDLLNENLLNHAEQGNLNKVRLYVKYGADIHYKNDLPFRMASIRGHLNTTKYLLKQITFRKFRFIIIKVMASYMVIQVSLTC